MSAWIFNRAYRGFASHLGNKPDAAVLILCPGQQQAPAHGHPQDVWLVLKRKIRYNGAQSSTTKYGKLGWLLLAVHLLEAPHCLHDVVPKVSSSRGDSSRQEAHDVSYAKEHHSKQTYGACTRATSSIKLEAIKAVRPTGCRRDHAAQQGEGSVPLLPYPAAVRSARCCCTYP